MIPALPVTLASLVHRGVEASLPLSRAAEAQAKLAGVLAVMMTRSGRSHPQPKQSLSAMDTHSGARGLLPLQP